MFYALLVISRATSDNWTTTSAVLWRIYFKRTRDVCVKSTPFDHNVDERDVWCFLPPTR